MRGWLWFAPVVLLSVFAAYMGFQAGQLPSETQIFNRYVAAYLANAPDGAKPTDCAGRPHPDPKVRVVITCRHPAGFFESYYAGPRAEPVLIPDLPGV